MFVWVPLFRKRVVTASIGTYIHGVLVNDGYLCSRVYGNLRLLVNYHNIITSCNVEHQYDFSWSKYLFLFPPLTGWVRTSCGDNGEGEGGYLTTAK